jgi:hypothetical protein
VLHRAPGAADWEEWELDRAMDRVAELVKKTRDVERLPNGKLVNMTPAIFSLGRHPRRRVEPHPAEADAGAGHRHLRTRLASLVHKRVGTERRRR